MNIASKVYRSDGTSFIHYPQVILRAIVFSTMPEDLQSERKQVAIRHGIGDIKVPEAEKPEGVMKCFTLLAFHISHPASRPGNWDCVL